MTTTNATKFRSNMFSYIDNTIKYNDPLTITSKGGNAVLISEQEYNGILATLEIMQNKPLYKDLQKLKDEPLNNCVPENNVVW